MINQIFVNLPVKDLNKSVEFFTWLGFTFDPRFTDQNATCMILGQNMFAMLLVEEFFKSFTHKDIPDTTHNSEAIIAMQVDSRDQVDLIMSSAIKAGGREFEESQDQGWMYSRGFEDLDGHLWEVIFMDISAMPLV